MTELVKTSQGICKFYTLTFYTHSYILTDFSSLSKICHTALCIKQAKKQYFAYSSTKEFQKDPWLLLAIFPTYNAKGSKYNLLRDKSIWNHDSDKPERPWVSNALQLVSLVSASWFWRRWFLKGVTIYGWGVSLINWPELFDQRFIPLTYGLLSRNLADPGPAT